MTQNKSNEIDWKERTSGKEWKNNYFGSNNDSLIIFSL